MEEIYEKLSKRNYKEYFSCQLPGCNNPIVKQEGQKIRKYCCKEHAKKAQMMYKRMYETRNKDRVKVWRKNYANKLKEKNENQ
jgi:hypothetical protein